MQAKGHYTDGDELNDSVTDVVKKAAESCDCGGRSSDKTVKGLIWPQFRYIPFSLRTSQRRLGRIHRVIKRQDDSMMMMMMMMMMKVWVLTTTFHIADEESKMEEVD